MKRTLFSCAVLLIAVLTQTAWAQTLDPIYSDWYGTFAGTTTTVGPYRWIIRKTGKYGSTPSYVREMHFFDEDTDDATAISEISEYSESSDSWFDLGGRRLSGKPSQKGIFIHNGRKEVVR